MRFGVLGLFHPEEIELRAAGAEVLMVSGGPQPVVLNGEPGHRSLLLRAAGDRVVFAGSAVTQIRVSGRGGGTGRLQLRIPAKIVRTYTGLLAITARDGQLIVTLEMEREQAVAAIVASEMPQGAPLEALKAQAVVTRSFMAAGGRHRDFDFCDTTHCQFLRTPDDAGSQVLKATEETSGQVLTWNQHPIAAMYSSRCGGQTISMREAGADSGNGYPYYSVRCRWCREHPLHWTRQIESESVAVPKAGDEAARIRYARQKGWSALPGNQFSISHAEDGEWAEGRNLGHGLGLCQLGAMGMAARGQDFRTILMTYYPNSSLERLP